MKKTTLLRMAYVLFLFQTSHAQTILKEISLNQQILNSNLVLEGTVISRKSYWDENHEKIHTINTIEATKIFKGEVLYLVDVVTPGGVIGLDAQVVTPSLELNIGEKGVFVLRNVNYKMSGDKSPNNKRFRSYGSLQGYYKYDAEHDKAYNVFSVYQGITSQLHHNIESITNVAPVQLSDIDLSNKENALLENNKLAFVISAFSPVESTAGTKSVLTISGSDFGTVQGKVAFTNANDAGASFIDALDSQVLSWTNTEIRVEIPSKAGTGKIKVIRNDAISLTSSDNLMITFSQANIVSDAISSGNDVAYLTQLINKNGDGGYTWHTTEQMANILGAKEAFGRAMETWRCETKVNWKLENTALGASLVNQHRAANDGFNVVAFDNSNSANPDDDLPESVLGRRTSYYAACAINGGTSLEWYIDGFDIVFDGDRNWNFDTASIEGTELFDFESIALHELGHCRQLDHIIDTENVMHFAIAKGEELRSLSSENVNGGDWVHNRSTETITCNQLPMQDYVCQGLGVEEDLLNQALSVYPNPTNGILHIKNDPSVQLKKIDVYDIRSRLVLSQNISQGRGFSSLNFNGMSKGLYLINIHSDKTLITKKIILK